MPATWFEFNRSTSAKYRDHGFCALSNDCRLPCPLHVERPVTLKHDLSSIFTIIHGDRRLVAWLRFSTLKIKRGPKRPIVLYTAEFMQMAHRNCNYASNKRACWDEFQSVLWQHWPASVTVSWNVQSMYAYSLSSIVNRLQDTGSKESFSWFVFIYNYIVFFMYFIDDFSFKIVWSVLLEGTAGRWSECDECCDDQFDGKVSLLKCHWSLQWRSISVEQIF
jgi:hypothetical protein